MTDKQIRLHFQKNDPLLYKIITKTDFKDWQNPSHTPNDYFLRLVRAIIGQQLSVKAAKTINARFEKLFKGQITPKKILSLPDQKLRDVGMSWGKVGFVKDLAQKSLEKKINYSKFNKMSDEEIADELIKVKGIGLWTIEMFLMFALGRPDIFSEGDAGLKRAIKNIYGHKKPPINKWRPYRSYACFALWESLDNN